VKSPKMLLTGFVFFPLLSCSPLQQAPLVYSSGFDVGLHVGANGASPTPEIHIGVRKLDGAYVPVAVAKPCDDKVATPSCTADIYKMVLVNGNNDVRRTAPPRKEEFNDYLLKYSQAEQTLHDKEDHLTHAKDDLVRKTASLETAKIPPPQNGDAANSVPAESVAAPAANTPSQNGVAAQATPAKPVAAPTDVVANAQQDFNVAQESVTKAQNERDLADTKLKDIFTKLQALFTGTTDSKDGNTRKDALSVYGTFNADTKANSGTSPNAGLTLGQTFSTGVASQHIAEGLRDSARAGAIANCLTSAKALYGDGTGDADKSQWKSLVALCGTAIAQ
jgi:hypothetical protein